MADGTGSAIARGANRALNDAVMAPVNANKTYSELAAEGRRFNETVKNINNLKGVSDPDKAAMVKGQEQIMAQSFKNRLDTNASALKQTAQKLKNGDPETVSYVATSVLVGAATSKGAGLLAPAKTAGTVAKTADAATKATGAAEARPYIPQTDKKNISHPLERKDTTTTQVPNKSGTENTIEVRRDEHGRVAQTQSIFKGRAADVDRKRKRPEQSALEKIKDRGIAETGNKDLTGGHTSSRWGSGLEGLKSTVPEHKAANNSGSKLENTNANRLVNVEKNKGNTHEQNTKLIYFSGNKTTVPDVVMRTDVAKRHGQTVQTTTTVSSNSTGSSVEITSKPKPSVPPKASTATP